MKDDLFIEWEAKIVLKCIKCGEESTEEQYFAMDRNEITEKITTDKEALEYEFGAKEQHENKHFWECDCGASMYIKEVKGVRKNV